MGERIGSWNEFQDDRRGWRGRDGDGQWTTRSGSYEDERHHGGRRFGMYEDRPRWRRGWDERGPWADEPRYGGGYDDDYDMGYYGAPRNVRSEWGWEGRDYTPSPGSGPSQRWRDEERWRNDLMGRGMPSGYPTPRGYSPGGRYYPGTYGYDQSLQGSYAQPATYGQGRMPEGPYAGRGPKGYRRNYERVAEEVNEALARHPGVDASNIEVRCDDGEVTLTGTVEDRHQKRMAEQAVERVDGVRDVHNHIRVVQMMGVGNQAPHGENGGSRMQPRNPGMETKP